MLKVNKEINQPSSRHFFSEVCSRSHLNDYKKILCSLISAYAISLSANSISNFVDQNGYPRFIPAVQKFVPTEGKFVLPESLTVTAPSEAAYSVNLIGRALEKHFPKHSVTTVRNGVCRLVLTSESVPESPEGYMLKIGRDGIEIRAKDLRGLYYGAQTLCNIIRNIPSPELPGMAIEDWPDLKLRGAYLPLRFYTSQDAAHFLKVIEAFGALKYNTLYLEFADNFPYKSNPFTLRKSTLSEEDLRQIVRVAQANKIKIVPFLQILSHDSWLQTHPKYKTDISEGKPDSPWCSASCPSRPLPRQLNLMAINEQIEFFQPEHFCISLDEISQCPWGVCSICRTKDLEKLWEEQVLFYTGEVLRRGVSPVIFYDSFYPGNRVNGERVLPKLDPRVVICNWDYAETIKTARFDFFGKYKFPVIGMSYCLRLNNTGALPLEIMKRGMDGVVLSFWGHLQKFTDPGKITPEGFAGIVTAADYQWKCRALPVASLNYDPAYEAIRLFLPERALEPRPGIVMSPIPLEKVVNTVLGNDENFPILDKAMIENLRNELANSKEKFRLVTSGDNYYAVVISGGNDNYPATEITIPVGSKVDALSFLLATGRMKNTVEGYFLASSIGRITFVRADGSESTLDLRYRDSINFWNATASGLSLRFVSRFNDKRNALCSLFALDWRNPAPDIVLKEIRFGSNQSYGIAPALFAISGDGRNVQADTSPLVTPSPLSVTIQRDTTETGKKDVRETILAGFDSGMGPAHLKYSGKFASEVKYEVITDKNAPIPGKVLQIAIPPTADPYAKNRIFVDVDFDRSKIVGEINSIFLDYQIEEPEFIFYDGTYMMDRTNGGALRFLKFTRFYNDNQWHHISLPLKMMESESGGTTGTKGNRVRVSFSLRYHDRPFTIRLARIGVSNETAGLPPQLILIEKILHVELDKHQ